MLPPIQIGDIVHLRGRDGLFVFVGNRSGEIPPLTQGRFIRGTLIDPQNPHEAITIGIASATLVISPVFTAGETVTYEHSTATVVSDDLAEGTVRIEFVRRPNIRNDERWSEQTWRADAHRATLVQHNVHKFIDK